MASPDLYDLYEDNYDIQKEQEALNVRKKELEEKKANFSKVLFFKKWNRRFEKPTCKC